MDQNATGCKRTVEKFMNSNLIDEARNRAMDVLSRCYTPHGFRASALAAGYPQIWARDNGIMMLGVVASGDPA